MFFKKKGQGALEYLLLIGGAVLIAVIVIALLVGMGGQSRDTAQDQATKAQQALDQPQPATIVSVTPLSSPACVDGTDTVTGSGSLTIDWQKLGEGGSYTLEIFDYTGTNSLEVVVDGTGDESLVESPANVVLTIPINGNCKNTYWAEITTNKNGQTVKSTRAKFNW